MLLTCAAQLCLTPCSLLAVPARHFAPLLHELPSLALTLQPPNVLGGDDGAPPRAGLQGWKRDADAQKKFSRHADLLSYVESLRWSEAGAPLWTAAAADWSMHRPALPARL